MCLNLVLLLVSITILLLNGGHFAQDINFLASPNPGYQSGLAMLSFVVFAILPMAELKRLVVWSIKRKIQKELCQRYCFAAIVISIGYSLAIFYGASAQTGSRY